MTLFDDLHASERRHCVHSACMVTGFMSGPLSLGSSYGSGPKCKVSTGSDVFRIRLRRSTPGAFTCAMFVRLYLVLQALLVMGVCCTVRTQTVSVQTHC